MFSLLYKCQNIDFHKTLRITLYQIERIVYINYESYEKILEIKQQINKHCVKSVRNQSFSGPYSLRMRENTNQKNFEYGHISCSENYIFINKFPYIYS